MGPRDGGKRLAAPPRTGVLLMGVVVLMLLSLMGPFMSYGDFAVAGEGSPARQAGYLLLFGLALVGINPVADPNRVLVVPVAIVIALAWCWLSVSWALAPGVAVRRIFLTTIVIWSIFAIIRNVGYEQPVAVIRVMLAMLLIINIAVSMLFPEYGVHHVNEPGDKGLIGDWRGVMVHKNFAGPTAALAALFFLFDAKRIPMVLRVCVVAAACYFLYRSGSKTSVGIGIFAVALGTLLQFYTGRYRTFVMLVLAIAGMAAAVVAYLYQDPLSGNFTDENAFTGRPLIWKALIDFTSQHPWTGAGYGSFWNIGGNDPIFHLATGWVTETTIGHNGFLDMLAQVGIPGLILMLIAAVILPSYRILTATGVPAPRLALILSILYFCIGHNSTESSLFERDAIPQVFLMLAIAFAEVSLSRSPRPALPSPLMARAS